MSLLTLSAPRTRCAAAAMMVVVVHCLAAVVAAPDDTADALDIGAVSPACSRGNGFPFTGQDAAPDDGWIRMDRPPFPESATPARRATPRTA